MGASAVARRAAWSARSVTESITRSQDLFIMIEGTRIALPVLDAFPASSLCEPAGADRLSDNRLDARTGWRRGHAVGGLRRASVRPADPQAVLPTARPALDARAHA